MDHLRILGIEPSSVIPSQHGTMYSKIVRFDALMLPRMYTPDFTVEFF